MHAHLKHNDFGFDCNFFFPEIEFQLPYLAALAALAAAAAAEYPAPPSPAPPSPPVPPSPPTPGKQVQCFLNEL